MESEKGGQKESRGESRSVGETGEVVRREGREKGRGREQDERV